MIIDELVYLLISFIDFTFGQTKLRFNFNEIQSFALLEIEISISLNIIVM